MTILKPTDQDIPQLVQLINSAYRGEQSRKGWTHEADLLEGDERIDAGSLQQLLNNTDNTMLVVKDNNNVLGCVMLERQGEQVYLGMLSVSPTLQANGIGKKLLQESEAFARSIGIYKIVMTVISVRHELIAWYKRRGYTDTGIRKPFPTEAGVGLPKQPLEFIVMEKELPQ